MNSSLQARSEANEFIRENYGPAKDQLHLTNCCVGPLPKKNKNWWKVSYDHIRNSHYEGVQCIRHGARTAHGPKRVVLIATN